MTIVIAPLCAAFARRLAPFAFLSLLAVATSAVAVEATSKASPASTPPAKTPVQLIRDFDMESDCDDAGALAMAHVLADRGECDILAVLSCSRHPWTVPCIDAINT